MATLVVAGIDSARKTEVPFHAAFAATTWRIDSTMDFYAERIYYLPAPDDGTGFLVDGIWPRGISKEQIRLPPCSPPVIR